MKNNKKLALVLLVVGALFSSNPASSQNLDAQFETLLTKDYGGTNPGVTALVYKDGEVIYRKAFGMANLELDVAMKPENVIEIGSITKQFTAVAILMLEEQGKLSIEDNITKFIPDYPVQGKTITLHHLLNHTSGIKSYTGMPTFIEFGREDHSPEEIVDFFKNEPMDFDPGEEYLYNNSGYILLGHIIEKVSGKSYADFLQDHIFTPLKMTNSYYGSKIKLIKNRAEGYSPNAEGWQKALPMSMTWPYAAGAIMSNVDDMLLWHKAVHNNTLISADSKEKAFSNSNLNNGKPINYGYGWAINEINGSPMLEHGGGIFGYTTAGLYAPEENVYVIVLTNRDGSHPGEVALSMTAHALGKPYSGAESAISLTDAQLKKWVGNYIFDDEVLRSVTFANGKLYSQREGNDKLEIFPLSENMFIFDNGTTSCEFTEENGKKTVLFADRINTSKGVETDQKPATEKEEIEIDTKILPDYVGEFVIAPTFSIVVTTKDEKLYLQATGQPQFQAYPEAEDTFFLKVVAAKLVFERDENGAVNSVVLHQGGQEIKGIKK